MARGRSVRSGLSGEDAALIGARRPARRRPPRLGSNTSSSAASAARSRPRRRSASPDIHVWAGTTGERRILGAWKSDTGRRRRSASAAARSPIGVGVMACCTDVVAAAVSAVDGHMGSRARAGVGELQCRAPRWFDRQRRDAVGHESSTQWSPGPPSRLSPCGGCGTSDPFDRASSRSSRWPASHTCAF